MLHSFLPFVSFLLLMKVSATRLPLLELGRWLKPALVLSYLLVFNLLPRFLCLTSPRALSQAFKENMTSRLPVKPQNLTLQFFAETSTNPNSTLLSVVAGKPIKAFQDGGFKKVAWSMPKMLAQIGHGMTVWCSTENISTTE